MLRTSRMRALLLSLLQFQAAAQLLGCSDIDFRTKSDFCGCRVQDVTFNALGIANFSSALSSKPLTWTLGWVNNANFDTPSLRNYYLGTPQGLALNEKTDVVGCALFFTGVEAGLRFVNPLQNQTSSIDEVSGTCADALGATCESDLLSQAQNLTSESTALADNLCSDLARDLQLALPKSCAKVRSWGNITAKVITGSNSPSPLQLNGCTPTTNNTYEIRNVASFPETFAQDYFNAVTPLLTVFVPSAGAAESPSAAQSTITSAEAHLSCMRPMANRKPNQVTMRGGATTFAPRGYLTLASVMLLNLVF